MANCTTYVSVDSLCFADNVRSTQCERIPEMVASYRRAGCFKSNHPLVISTQENGDLLVLNGNRRGLGLQWLRDNDAAEYKRICSTGKVPAVVHKNLTIEEEIDLRIDHSTDEDRVPLDEWSIFLAIKQLVSIGSDSQEEIARKLGLFKSKGKEAGKPNRQYVQPRVNLARLPGFVQAQYLTLCYDRDKTAVRWSHLANLRKVYTAEFVSFPDGDGPKFTELWNKCLTPTPQKVKDADASKALTPTAALQRSQAAGSKGLRDALLAITDQGAGDITVIDSKILAGELAVETLAHIKLYLGDDDYAELIGASQGQPVAV